MEKYVNIGSHLLSNTKVEPQEQEEEPKTRCDDLTRLCTAVVVLATPCATIDCRELRAIAKRLSFLYDMTLRVNSR